MPVDDTAPLAGSLDGTKGEEEALSLTHLPPLICFCQVFVTTRKISHNKQSHYGGIYQASSSKERPTVFSDLCFPFFALSI